MTSFFPPSIYPRAALAPRAGSSPPRQARVTPASNKPTKHTERIQKPHHQGRSPLSRTLSPSSPLP